MTGKEKLRTWLVCLALAIGAALLYAPVLGFKFINLDDILYVVNNFHIRHFSRQSLVWCFQTTYASLWHPLTWISHMLDCQLFGMWAGGHHATSVVLHVLNSLLLFIILRRMTGAFWRSAMVAALFAWHPLHVESVAWIAERKDVLSTFFWMLTVWAYVRYAEEFKIQNSKFKILYVLALVFFALGLMAKPMLVTLPFVLLLFDWWPLGRMQMNPPNLNRNLNPNPNPKNSHGSTSSVAKPMEDKESRPAKSRPAQPRPAALRLLMEKIPFLVMAVIACVITLHTAGGSMVSLERLPLGTRLADGLVSYSHYVEKMIWPHDLVVVYPFNFDKMGGKTLLSGLFLVVFSIVALRAWKTRPYCLAGWLFYLGVLVPVIGLVQVGAQPIADRYTYLPSVGIFVMVCWYLCDLVIGWQNGRAILATAAVAALAACFLLSRNQLKYWKDSETLFLHNIAVTPDNPMAHANYAAFLCDDQQLDKAEAECKTALHLSPNDPSAHYLLGLVLFLERRYDGAIPELNAALRLNPKDYRAHLVLARISLMRNFPAEAASHISVVLAADATNPEAHCILGEALGGQGKLDQACAQFNEALRLAPNYPDAHHQFAVALAMQHQTSAAISHYRAALAAQPDRDDTLNNLAWLLATDPRPENRDGPEAVRLASHLCELTRRQEPFFLGTLAASFAEAGRYDEAVATAQQAHDLALAQGKTDIAARNLQLLALYRAHQPYHEGNSSP
jgi:tetratricopeptide (TPR) repeat protein